MTILNAILIAFTFLISNNSQTEEIPLPKRLTTYLWSGGDWVPHNTQIEIYDSNGLKIESRSERLETNEIIPFSSELFRYEKGLLKDAVFRRWRGNEWINIHRKTWSYSTDSNSVVMEKQTFESGEWINLDKETVYKSPINQIDSIIIQFHTKGKWKLFLKKIIKYLPNGDTASIIVFSRTDSSWSLSGKSEFNRNKNGKLLSIVTYNCYKTYKDCRTASIKEYRYQDDGKMSQEIQKTSLSGKLENECQYIYEYNSDGMINNKIYLKWENGKWNNWISKIQEYYYDIDLFIESDK